MENSTPLLKTENGTNFLRVVIGRLISQFGAQITGFAITVWIYQQTDSLSLFGLMIFLYAAPRLLVAPIAGNLIDKYNRRTVILVSEISALIVISLLLLVNWNDGLNLISLGIFTIVIASIAVVQVVVLAAATAQLLPEENRMTGNAIIQVGFAVNQMLAPAIAGFLVYQFGLTTVLFIHVGLLVIAFATLTKVRFDNLKDKQEENSESNWQAFKIGLAHVLNKRILLVLALFTLMTNFILTGAEVLLAPLVLSYETAEILGRLMALAGVGIFIGGLTSMMAAKTKNKEKLIVVAQSISGICLIVMGSQHSVWLWAMCIVVIFAAIAFSAACNQTIWQNRTPLEMHGRVFAVKEMITTAIVPLAYLLSPIIADKSVRHLLEEYSWLQNLTASGDGQPIAFMFMLLGGSLIIFCAFTGFSGILKNNISEPTSDAQTDAQLTNK